MSAPATSSLGPLNILVPLDFSVGGADALRVACQIQAHRGGSVSALNVARPPTHVDGRSAWGPGEKETRLARAQELGLAFLANNEIEGVEMFAEAGDPSTKITEFSERDHVQLIVMTAHGKNWMDRFVLGSATERVVRLARCPVLVLPPPSRAKRTPKDWGDAKRVIVPFDFDDLDVRAIGYAESFVGSSAQVSAIHVVALPTPPILDVAWNPLDPRAISEGVDKAVQAELHKRGFPQVKSAVRLGRVATEVVAAAQADEAELIIVASRERSGLSRFVLGSVADSILRTADCPVLVLHGHDVRS